MPILLYRGYPLKKTENLVWAGGNALGAAIQFFGLLLGPFQCRLVGLSLLLLSFVADNSVPIHCVFGIRSPCSNSYSCTN